MNRALWVLAGLVVLACVVPAQASINGVVDQNDDLYLNPTVRPAGFNGGPWWAAIYDDASSGIAATHPSSLQVYPVGAALVSTFCVEVNNYISGDVGWYNVYGLSTTNGFGRKLTGYAAWVYNTWRNLPSAMSLPDATKVLFQKAIWAGVSKDVANGADTEYVAEYGSPITDWAPYEAIGISYADFLASGWGLNNLGGYEMVEIGPNGGQQAQMFMSSGGTAPTSAIPEPAALIVWSLLGTGSWLGMRVWRRRGTPVGRQPWSPENRTAILDIIERGRH
jgi:hypothetical protein